MHVCDSDNFASHHTHYCRLRCLAANEAPCNAYNQQQASSPLSPPLPLSPMRFHSTYFSIISQSLDKDKLHLVVLRRHKRYKRCKRRKSLNKVQSALGSARFSRGSLEFGFSFGFVRDLREQICRFEIAFDT